MKTHNRKHISAALAVLCILLGIVFRFVSRGMGFLASCMVAAVIPILFFGFIGDSKAAKILKTVVAVILALLIVAAVFTEAAIIFHAKTTADGDEDWLIIMGAGLNGSVVSYSLRTRLERALEYLETNGECRIIVSGGMGEGETVTEAEAMKDYLVNAGIDESRIITEDKAKNTEENIKFSFDIIASEKLTSSEYSQRKDKLAVLSNGYHLYRISRILKENTDIEFSEINYISARTQRFIIVNYYLREIAALWYGMIA